MTDFLQHLSAAIGPRPPDGVHLAPAIDPKKLANALRWAPFGNETPLLLIDDSVWSSGKAGALITTHALYCDEPRLRIELGFLQYPPTYPEGPAESPRVWTPHGEAKLKKMTLDDVQGAWTRVLAAIVNVNTGRAVAPQSAAPVAGPLGELAMRHLVHEDILLSPAIPTPKLHKAATHFSDWLDYANGEQLIAYLDETALGGGSEGVALTDRRLLAHVGDKHWIVPYGALVGVDASKGFLEKKLALAAGPYSGQIPLISRANACENLVQFLRGVTQLPPDQRWVPAPSFASANDPTGAATLAGSLVAPDPRVPLMLQYVHEATARSVMSVEMGFDLVERIHVVHRTLAHGRGAQQGFRISPLHGEDFSFLLHGVFGAPLGVAGDGATRVLDFAVGRSGSAVGAAASSAVGLAMLAVVGVGWVSTPKKTIQGVRMTLRDLGRGTGFAAHGALGGALYPLQDIEPEVLDWVVDALDDLEALTIFERAVFGWQVPAADLFGVDPNALAHRVHALLGPADLSPFRPT